MEWEFKASTPAEMAQVRQSLPETAPSKVANELFQMAGLLENLASTTVLDFPVTAVHHGEKGVPDFRITSNGHAIGVELAMLAVADVEHARALQQKGSLGTL